MRKKYAASANYMGLEDIAKKMTEDGDKMNHSTVRNYILSGMEKLALSYLDYLDYKGDRAAKAKKLSKDALFHEFISEQMREMIRVDKKES